MQLGHVITLGKLLSRSCQSKQLLTRRKEIELKGDLPYNSRFGEQDYAARTVRTTPRLSQLFL